MARRIPHPPATDWHRCRAGKRRLWAGTRKLAALWTHAGAWRVLDYAGHEVASGDDGGTTAADAALVAYLAG